ncbi:hypothetical protein IFR05_012565 [Cadophora sp. M221]|nr:hypothetical protein IFR05_012565 [Cadophora sp. M221]
MHLNHLLLAALSLAAPGFSAPTVHSPNIEISINTEAPLSGSESAHYSSQAGNVFCYPGTFYGPMKNCARVFGPGWYFDEDRQTCCIERRDDENGVAGAIESAPEVSRSDEQCYRAWFPPGFNCKKFGPEWYYNKRSNACCKSVSSISQEASTVAVPTQEDSLVSEICSPRWIPNEVPREVIYGPEWYYNKETHTCCKRNKPQGDFSVELLASLQDDMPTGFEPKSSVHSNMNAHGDMPTGFESKSRVEAHENVHTEML